MVATWLECHYNGRSFDYAVYDVDLMQIFDLIGDLGPAALKQNVLIPNVYNLYYKCGNGSKVYIKNDWDLLRMFENFHEVETIHVWLEETSNPIKEFAMYFDLLRSHEEERKRGRRDEEIGKGG
ncbi:hypothetical protein RND81_10G184100 [Saponaria officinalis]|uniref:Uncharacterized protein n=1 Tax=Saponaria officinalis TaxID=3572 RepID=A0AAW1I6C3_SAPOF